MYQFSRVQLVKAKKEELWDFISSPANLKTITPPYMGFDIKNPNLPEKMYPGIMISYTVKPIFGIPLPWSTEITHVEEGHYFVDEQRRGPYKIWHHEHRLRETEDGIRMEDTVSYLPPFAFMGFITNPLIIEPKLKQIFEFRSDKIQEIFPGSGPAMEF